MIFFYIIITSLLYFLIATFFVQIQFQAPKYSPHNYNVIKFNVYGSYMIGFQKFKQDVGYSATLLKFLGWDQEKKDLTEINT